MAKAKSASQIILINYYRGFTALLLFASAHFELKRRVRIIRVLKFFADASYSIYLAQAFLLLVFFKIIYLAHLPTTALFSVTALLFTLLLAGLFHVFV